MQGNKSFWLASDSSERNQLHVGFHQNTTCWLVSLSPTQTQIILLSKSAEFLLLLNGQLHNDINKMWTQLGWELMGQQSSKTVHQPELWLYWDTARSRHSLWNTRKQLNQSAMRVSNWLTGKKWRWLCCTQLQPLLRRWRREDCHEFEVSLSYIRSTIPDRTAQ